MNTASLVLAAAATALLAATVWRADAQPAPPQSASAIEAEMQNRAALKPVGAFASIADPARRSQALFVEMGKVIGHPRCANCHPVDRPVQGDDRHPHMPVVFRGPDGHGDPALRCTTCHTGKNVWVGGRDIVTIPGNPDWRLAPVSMAWQGKSLGEICAQIKDPARNGGKTLAQIHDHMAGDSLVGWGWNPGAGRAPAPGTQAQFGELVKAWIDTGAKCPTGGAIVPAPKAS